MSGDNDVVCVMWICVVVCAEWLGIRQALLITRGPPPYRGLYHSLATAHSCKLQLQLVETNLNRTVQLAAWSASGVCEINCDSWLEQNWGPIMVRLRIRQFMRSYDVIA